jgi:hypothetical protein
MTILLVDFLYQKYKKIQTTNFTECALIIKEKIDVLLLSTF